MSFDMDKLSRVEREFFDVLKESGRTPYQLAKEAIAASLGVDHEFVSAVAEKYGADKAIEMHQKKWAPTIEGGFVAGKAALGIDKVDDLDKLIRIRMWMNDGTPCPSKINEEPGRAGMTVLACPLIQVAREMFKEDLNSTWLQAAAATEDWIYGKLIELAGLEDKVAYKADRFACLDGKHPVCRGVYYWKGDPEPKEPVSNPKEGRFGDCRDLSLDDALDYCLSVTDKTPEELALAGTKAKYAGVYYSWRALFEEFGSEEAGELYWAVWKHLLTDAYNQTVAALGMKQPKTVHDLGKIHEAFFVGSPARYKVVKDGDDEWIAECTWCPNPELGPPDVHSTKMAYYQTEYALSLKVNQLVIELAGLETEIETLQPTGYCAFAHECADKQSCQFIYRKKS
jgi:hypothetical protein